MFSRALFRKHDFSACSQTPSFDVPPSPGQPENRVSRAQDAQDIDFWDLPTQRPENRVSRGRTDAHRFWGPPHTKAPTGQLDYTRSLGECGPVGRVLTNTGTVYSNPGNL